MFRKGRDKFSVYCSWKCPKFLDETPHLVGEQSIFSELSLLHIRHYDGAGVAVQKRCLSFRVQSLVGGPEGRHGNRWV